jgi:hypothetical protein
MAKNVISVKGGVIHLPATLDENGAILPLCPVRKRPGAVFKRADGKVTCSACKKRLKAAVKPAESAVIPRNWLWMAKHANTKTARAWWRKKCGIIETEN